MNYDFEQAPNRRGVGAIKWELMLHKSGALPADVLPYSIADMEFATAPEINEGLIDYLQHNTLGYTWPTDAYYDAVSRWMQRRHGFSVDRSQIVLSDGVVPALDAAVRIFTKPGDAVLVPTPVYHPFFHAVEQANRTLVTCDLSYRDSVYTFDFDAFAASAARSDVTLCILSSPHNPIGKVYTRDELTRIAEICLKNNVYLICDEIHNDLILPGVTFTSAGTLPSALRQNILLCTAPSKTFNLAGLACSNLIFFDEARKKQFEEGGGAHNVNVLGLIACKTAYEKAEPWLDALLLRLEDNRKAVEAYLQAELPILHAVRLEGTYLMWIDCRALGMAHTELLTFLEEKALLYPNDGAMFGHAGEGFIRWNIACPKANLLSALERLKQAIILGGLYGQYRK